MYGAQRRMRCVSSFNALLRCTTCAVTAQRFFNSTASRTSPRQLRHENTGNPHRGSHPRTIPDVDPGHLAELQRVCDVIYRSSSAREKLCQAIREPSPEIALRHLAEFSSDPGVWRRKEWANAFLSADDLTSKVALALERVVQWYTARKAPHKVVMEEPWDWYPKARLMRRRFFFHHGATNSGKTHAALEAFTQAKSGVYCAPLKALASQVWSRVNATVPCDLLIGDERRFGGGAEHVSCTVEMTPIDLQVDVGVIDEIQMIGDRDRGWAWTRALLALPAREIHLCGESRALSLVENLLYKTFERNRITARAHQRLVPLRACKPLHGDLSRVENGDCLICFSRKAVMDLHKELRSYDGVQSSYIYGAMPFAVRERQANAFNEGAQASIVSQASPSAASASTKHVLVSTDAIAYGLNMNIERVVFTTLKKFDGKAMIDVPAPTVKQISGRAGRYGLVRQRAEGRYTTLHSGADYDALVKAMQTNEADIPRAGLLPTADILQLYVELAEKNRTRGAPEEESLDFATLMKRFAAACAPTSLFFPCDFTRSLLRLAEILEAVPTLALKDRILFCYLPLNDSSRESVELVTNYAAEHATGGPVQLRIDSTFDRLVSDRHYRGVLHRLQQPTGSRGGREDLEGERQRYLSKLERLFRQAEMYCWLSWRFQATFTQREAGAALKDAVAAEMERLVL